MGDYPEWRDLGFYPFYGFPTSRAKGFLAHPYCMVDEHWVTDEHGNEKLIRDGYIKIYQYQQRIDNQNRRLGLPVWGENWTAPQYQTIEYKRKMTRSAHVLVDEHDQVIDLPRCQRRSLNQHQRQPARRHKVEPTRKLVFVPSKDCEQSVPRPKVESSHQHCKTKVATFEEAKLEIRKRPSATMLKKSKNSQPTNYSKYDQPLIEQLSPDFFAMMNQVVSQSTFSRAQLKPSVAPVAITASTHDAEIEIPAALVASTLASSASIASTGGKPSSAESPPQLTRTPSSHTNLSESMLEEVIELNMTDPTRNLNGVGIVLSQSNTIFQENTCDQINVTKPILDDIKRILCIKQAVGNANESHTILCHITKVPEIKASACLMEKTVQHQDSSVKTLSTDTKLTSEQKQLQILVARLSKLRPQTEIKSEAQAPMKATSKRIVSPPGNIIPDEDPFVERNHQKANPGPSTFNTTHDSKTVSDGTSGLAPINYEIASTIVQPEVVLIERTSESPEISQSSQSAKKTQTLIHSQSFFESFAKKFGTGPKATRSYGNETKNSTVAVPISVRNDVELNTVKDADAVCSVSKAMPSISQDDNLLPMQVVASHKPHPLTSLQLSETTNCYNVEEPTCVNEFAANKQPDMRAPKIYQSRGYRVNGGFVRAKETTTDNKLNSTVVTPILKEAPREDSASHKGVIETISKPPTERILVEAASKSIRRFTPETQSKAAGGFSQIPPEQIAPLSQISGQTIRNVTSKSQDEANVECPQTPLKQIIPRPSNNSPTSSLYVPVGLVEYLKKGGILYSPTKVALKSRSMVKHNELTFQFNKAYILDDVNNASASTIFDNAARQVKAAIIKKDAPTDPAITPGATFDYSLPEWVDLKHGRMYVFETSRKLRLGLKPFTKSEYGARVVQSSRDGHTWLEKEADEAFAKGHWDVIQELRKPENRDAILQYERDIARFSDRFPRGTFGFQDYVVPEQFEMKTIACPPRSTIEVERSTLRDTDVPPPQDHIRQDPSIFADQISVGLFDAIEGKYPEAEIRLYPLWSRKVDVELKVQGKKSVRTTRHNYDHQFNPMIPPPVYWNHRHHEDHQWINKIQPPKEEADLNAHGCFLYMNPADVETLSKWLDAVVDLALNDPFIVDTTTKEFRSGLHSATGLLTPYYPYPPELYVSLSDFYGPPQHAPNFDVVAYPDDRGFDAIQSHDEHMPWTLKHSTRDHVDIFISFLTQQYNVRNGEQAASGVQQQAEEEDDEEEEEEDIAVGYQPLHTRIAALNPLKPNPNSEIKPRVGMYVRPATAEDSAACLKIYNHWINNSNVVAHQDEVSDNFYQDLPLFVAASYHNPVTKRRKIHGPVYHSENIIGLGFARPWSIGSHPRFATTYELFIFSTPVEIYQRGGVAKVLLDRLLAAFDRDYDAQFPTVCHTAGLDLQQLYPGGLRGSVPARKLLVNILFTDDDIKDMLWKQAWLEKSGFEKGLYMPDIGIAGGGSPLHMTTMAYSVGRRSDRHGHERKIEACKVEAGEDFT